MANLEKEERKDLNEEDPQAVYDWAIENKERPLCLLSDCILKQ